MLDRIAVLAITAVCVLAPGLALAADDDEFTRTGWYAGAGAIYALQNFGDLDGEVTDHAGGFDLTLGYRANRVVSVEAEFEWAGFWELTAVPPDDDGRINVYTLGANVKLAYPSLVGGRLQPYGLFGFGFHRSRIDRGRDSNPPGSEVIDGMMKGGIGLDYYLTRHIVVSTEVAYSALFNRRQATDFLNVGLGLDYRF